ncbi:nuclear transport factor 2 family protein [Streptomyces bauhiniae]
MSTDQHRSIAPEALPEVVTGFLAAHRAHDTGTALGFLRPDATVTDDGHTHRGTPAIEAWMNRTAGEYTYTTELIGARQADADHYVVTHRLEGDFPGGVVDLHYRFRLGGGLIEDLRIEP